MKPMKTVFGNEKPIIGMLHLAGWNPRKVVDMAGQEAQILYDCGLSAVLVQNYFGNSVDVCRVLDMLAVEFPGKLYGVNVMGDARLGFQYARQYHAAFLQIDSICGHLPPDRDGDFAREIRDLRKTTEALVMGGVRFKHQPYLSGRPLEQDLELAMERCDAVVVTGESTGRETEISKIQAFRQVLGSFPLIVDAGVTAENIRRQLSLCDGAIVGSYLKEFGKTENRVDAGRVRRLMEAVKR